MSEAQGPGVRYTVWVQGCSIHCPQCSNIDTWDFKNGEEIDVDTLITDIMRMKDLDGITITGGEPLDQYGAVYELCLKLFGKISIFITTGYPWEKVSHQFLWDCVDIVCAGPFEADKICSGKWMGSSNQELLFLTERGKKQSQMPVVLKEIHIHKDGSAIETGFTV